MKRLWITSNLISDDDPDSSTELGLSSIEEDLSTLATQLGVAQELHFSLCLSSTLLNPISRTGSNLQDLYFRASPDMFDQAGVIALSGLQQLKRLAIKFRSPGISEEAQAELSEPLPSITFPALHQFECHSENWWPELRRLFHVFHFPRLEKLKILLQRHFGISLVRAHSLMSFAHRHRATVTTLILRTDEDLEIAEPITPLQHLKRLDLDDLDYPDFPLHIIDTLPPSVSEIRIPYLPKMPSRELSGDLWNDTREALRDTAATVRAAQRLLELKGIRLLNIQDGRPYGPRPVTTCASPAPPDPSPQQLARQWEAFSGPWLWTRGVDTLRGRWPDPCLLIK